MVNQLPGFYISRLANVEDFLMYIYFSNVSINVSANDYSFKYVCLSMLLETSFFLPHLSCNVEFEFRCDSIFTSR